MTTNQERAAEVIDTEHVKSMRNMRLPNPSKLARALDAAGLLAPELPPMTGVYWWRTGNARIDVTDAGAVSSRIENKNYTPERARKIALALLAAADYAEQEQDNE